MRHPLPRLTSRNCLIDTDRNFIACNGTESRVAPRTMEVLAYLIENAYRVVTAEELLERFWAGRVVEGSTIHRRISLIRQGLGDKARSPLFVRTISKRGYQFIAPVQPVGPQLPDATAAVASNVADAVHEGQLLCKTPTVARAQAALGCFERVLAVDPQRLDALTGMAVSCDLLAQMGNRNWRHHHAARDALARARALQPDAPEVDFVAGLLAYFEERDAQALASLDRVLANQPNHGEAQYYRAQCLYALSRFEEARAGLQQLLDQVPLMAEANMLMADTLAALGEGEEANAYHARAVALASDHPAVLCRAGRFCLWVQGDIEAGLGLCRQAWQLDPDDARTAVALMACMLVLGARDAREYWAGMVRRRHPHNQGLAFWRAPDADVAWEERRRYVETWRAREPANRDWLRVAAELELDLVRETGTGLADTLRTASLRRARELMAEYLERGGDARFDANGMPRDIAPRRCDGYALLTLAEIARLSGRSDIDKAVFTGLAAFIDGLPNGACTPMVSMLAVVCQARFGAVEAALDSLERCQPCGYVCIEFLDLVGLLDDTTGRWHDIGQHPRFRAFMARERARVASAVTTLRRTLPDLFTGRREAGADSGNLASVAAAGRPPRTP